MLPLLVTLLLAAPDAPTLREPLDGAWVNGAGGVYLGWYQPADDAGLALTNVRMDFRREDAGYGTVSELQPWSTGAWATTTFAENERWCWRLTAINSAMQASPPSEERCFRTDNTSPVSPAFVDAGAVVSSGRVVIEHTAAIDALSGVQAYVLAVAPTPAGPWYDNSPGVPAPPLTAWLGEGAWFGWVEVFDFANNSNSSELGSYAIPLTVTAAMTVPVPNPPVFWSRSTNQYGDGLGWDAGALAGLGATHVVESHCNVETGCSWLHGFTGVPVADESAWVQLGDEGTWRSRIAVVVGGQVGPWSAPSEPFTVDRTPPPRPSLVVTPAATTTPSFTLQWTAPPDDRAGLARFSFSEVGPPGSTPRTFDRVPPATSAAVVPPREGRFAYTLRSVDRANNQSPSSASVTVVYDRTGPRVMPPVAMAEAADGGAAVTLSWPAPIDELSGVASVELEETNADAGSVLFSPAGTPALRMVGPGRWTWALRATDALGNRGALSGPSNVIVVSGGTVAQGPAIVTDALSLECGVPFAGLLAGTGDPPLTWSLLAGPPGLTVSASGEVSWTPPSGASDTTIDVKLQNGVGFVTASIPVLVACALDAGTDAGTAGNDAGAGAPRPRELAVGCSCGHGLGAWVAAAVGLLARARRRRTVTAGRGAR